MGNNQMLMRPSARQGKEKMAVIANEQGELLMLNTSGFLKVANDSSGSDKVGGVALEPRDNSGGAAGDVKVLIDKGGAHNLMTFLLVKPTTAGSVDLTGGVAGSLDTITVDGVEILGGAVAFDTDLATTAENAIKQINQSQGDFFAYLSGTAVINIVERVTTLAALVIVSTSTTITTTDVNAAGGKVLVQASLGVDAYANTGRQAKLSGNKVIGTVESIDDGEGNQFTAKAAVGRVLITGAVGAISQITAGSTNLMGTVVTYTTSAAVTAGLIRDDINLLVNTHGYFAEVKGDEVLIYQTTVKLSEAEVILLVTGALDNVVTEEVNGGILPRVLVALDEFGT